MYTNRIKTLMAERERILGRLKDNDSEISKILLKCGWNRFENLWTKLKRVKTLEEAIMFELNVQESTLNFEALKRHATRRGTKHDV